MHAYEDWHSLKSKQKLSIFSGWKYENSFKPVLNVFLFKNSSQTFPKVNNTTEINQNALFTKVTTCEKKTYKTIAYRLYVPFYWGENLIHSFVKGHHYNESNLKLSFDHDNRFNNFKHIVSLI